MNQPHMNSSTYDDLKKLSNRLYCCWQSALHGDEMMLDHITKIGDELSEIWNVLENILEYEEDVRSYVNEEMKKFEQGFAYGRAPSAPIC